MEGEEKKLIFSNVKNTFLHAKNIHPSVPFVSLKIQSQSIKKQIIQSSNIL
jgi:hypothetical protein